MATVWLTSACASTLQLGKVARGGKAEYCYPIISSNLTLSMSPSSSSLLCSSSRHLYASCSHLSLHAIQRRRQCARVACVSSSSSTPARSATGIKLYVSGLSFRTTKESLVNAFQQFGELVEVNLVMDKIAKRPRGFAFLSYATEEESKKAIEGMHGKLLGVYMLDFRTVDRNETYNPAPLYPSIFSLISALRTATLISCSDMARLTQVIFVEVAKPRPQIQKNKNPE